MPKRIAILGSTGSIGKQSLDVISRYPDEFVVDILAAGSNVELLDRQVRQFRPHTVVIGCENHYQRLKESLQGIPVSVLAGSDAIAQAAASPGIDIVIAAMVGYSGLRPAISAIRAGKKIALANKETLVVAGEIICNLVKQTGCRIIPVDSEHSAIFQCLAGEDGNPVEKITLTASGGPFRDYTVEMLQTVKPAEALRHPNWDMGYKVTIDSASLMNKGLEMIEAKWLFDLSPEQINVIIHPQSIIHSLVHFHDGSVKAQMGIPDMRVPILYALSSPDRLNSDFPRLDLNKNLSLTFADPDTKKFRNLALAGEALKTGGNMPCILNAANEVAVNAFLSEQVGFQQMSDIIEYTLENTGFITSPDLDQLEFTDMKGRETANIYINKIRKI
jgi:1-deoxy-D-xylulose-5-phosphate reductoisomerase